MPPKTSMFDTKEVPALYSKLRMEVESKSEEAGTLERFFF